MSNIAIDAEKTPAAAGQAEPETNTKKPAKGTRPAAKKAKPAKKAKAAKKAKPADKKEKPAAERSNKKAEVIALMRRAKGATMAEIMAVTNWQKHTIRGFVSILGKKGEHNIESSKNAEGDRVYRITK